MLGFGRKLQEATPQSLLTLEQQLEARRLDLTDRLQAAQQEAGESALESVLGGSPSARSVSTASKEVAQLSAEVNATEAAIAGVRGRRVEAIRAQFEVEAAEQRRTADKLRAEADSLDSQCEPLLRKLSQLQGVTYDDSILYRQPDPSGYGFCSPKSEQIRKEAEQVETKAEQAAARRPDQAGRVEADSIEEIQQALVADPLRLAPTAQSVRAWAEKCEQALRQDHKH